MSYSGNILKIYNLYVNDYVKFIDDLLGDKLIK